MVRVCVCLVLLVWPALAVAQEPAPAPREKLKLGEWRTGERKKKLLTDGGGNEKTETAVAAGLKWLATQQRPDGLWEFTGNQFLNRRIAATAFATLCFLGAGHAPGDGGNYDKVTSAGVAALLQSRDEKTGAFRRGIEYIQMYDHAIGTLALVEAYGMTGDQKLKQPCQMAIDVIVKAQTKDGGWRYELRPGIAMGDVSSTGWVVQVLTAAKRYTDLDVPTETLEKASAFLDTCAKGNKKAAFGYVVYTNADPFRATTASGLCSKIALDGWTAENERLALGVAELLRRLPSPKPEPGKTTDPYFLYYATRAVYGLGGDAWVKQWNPKLHEALLTTQDKDGSWPATGYPPQVSGIGRFGFTCFYLLTLETYYRYPPTSGR